MLFWPYIFFGLSPAIPASHSPKKFPTNTPSTQLRRKKSINSRKKYEARQGKLQPCTTPLHIWQILIRPVGPTFRLTRNQIFRNCQHSLKSTLTCSSPHTHTHMYMHMHTYTLRNTHTQLSALVHFACLALQCWLHFLPFAWVLVQLGFAFRFVWHFATSVHICVILRF